MPELASVVPAPRFAATMGHYLSKIWNPREIFFDKSSFGQNPPFGFFFFFGRNPENFHFASRPGLEVNPLGVYPLG